MLKWLPAHSLAKGRGLRGGVVGMAGDTMAGDHAADLSPAISAIKKI